jgi:hypothetical protein
MKPLLPALLLLASLTVSGRTEILPLAPDKLLALAPAAPEGWTLKKSRAATDYSGWVSCDATRIMEGPVYPPEAFKQKDKAADNARHAAEADGETGAPADGEPPTLCPATISVRLTDTGLHAPKLARFQNFTVGTGRTLIQEQPAFQQFGSHRQRVTVCVNRRFILNIESRDLPKKVFREFIEKLDLRALAAVPNDGPTAFTRPLRVAQVDELNPANNGSYNLYWANPNE